MAIVYGYRNICDKKMNIGLKTSAGESMLTYITSVSSPGFWSEYSKGHMKYSLLFEGDEDTARTVEWFALQYGTAVKKDMFYNVKNNAHCIDESLLTSEIKKVVIDWIEEDGEGILVQGHYTQDKSTVTNISDNIRTGVYETVELSLTEVEEFMRNQVRVEEFDASHVSKIAIKMRENPAEARLAFGPIIVVVKADKSKWILDGNSRFQAAKKVKGWNTVPVIYINENEFGNDDKARQNNYDLFGLLENKESFEIKKSNTNSDLKRNIHNFIISEKFDLSKPLHVDRAREMIYDRFSIVCESKQQLNGILASILRDYEKHAAGLKYQKNLITYDDAFFETYEWTNYGIKDVATVHSSQTKARHAEVLGWMLRRMRNVKSDKGAIILYFKNKEELVNEDDEKWIEDLKSAIRYSNLPIEVDVLPAFHNEE